MLKRETFSTWRRHHSIHNWIDQRLANIRTVTVSHACKILQLNEIYNQRYIYMLVFFCFWCWCWTFYIYIYAFNYIASAQYFSLKPYELHRNDSKTKKTEIRRRKGEKHSVMEYAIMKQRMKKRSYNNQWRI